jgi:hypothetical protein
MIIANDNTLSATINKKGISGVSPVFTRLCPYPFAVLYGLEPLSFSLFSSQSESLFSHGEKE